MTQIKRLTGLDALRGVAALAVVAWHWQHFMALSGAWPNVWTRAIQPFYGLLKPLYLQGWAAVDVFFALSGFVFFWQYGTAIRERHVSATSFAVLRFSRLYPLHFALLIAVALLQALYIRRTGTFFIYADNDWRHFLLQLAMVQNWWPGMAQSFNGPGWSVSVEILLYLLFFLACRLGARAGWTALLIAIAGAPLFWLDEHIARGVIGFFMGGVAVALWQKIRTQRSAVITTRVLGILTLAGWAVLFVLLYRESAWLSGGESNTKFFVVFDYILCPLTVLALALHEAVGEHRYARLAFLGDISYSTYLLHFPMQLGLVLLALRIGLAPAFFMQDWVLLGFLALLILLGTLSYRYFERPLQNWLRRRLAPAPASINSSAAAQPAP